MFRNHSTDSLDPIKPANWGNFAVKPATEDWRLSIAWFCLLIGILLSPGTQAAEWRCGRDLHDTDAKSQTSGTDGQAWQALSGLEIHAIDEFSDPAFPDVKMRLADVAFVPEYRDAALQWIKAANHRDVEWLRLSEKPDYLGRYAVDIRTRSSRATTETDGSSWAERLLSQGLAMLLPQSGQDVASLVAAENSAIAQQAGLWSDRSADRAYLVSAASGWRDSQGGNLPQVHDAIGRFVVVEGKLLSVEHQEWRSYLNFGADWRRDFTIALDDASNPCRGSVTGHNIQPLDRAQNTGAWARGKSWRAIYCC